MPINMMPVINPTEEQQRWINRPEQKEEDSTQLICKCKSDGAVIPSMRVVCRSVTGVARAANHLLEADARTCAGITRDNYPNGLDIEAIYLGRFQIPRHGFPVGATLFLSGENGEFSDQEPATGWRKVVGRVLNEEEIFIDLTNEALFL